MRDNYDFSDSVKNPYAKKLKKQVTIRLDEDTINYFKRMSDDKGIPYQSLINLYLRDCAQSHKDLKWQQQLTSHFTEIARYAHSPASLGISQMVYSRMTSKMCGLPSDAVGFH